jgi:hypothetical protein
MRLRKIPKDVGNTWENIHYAEILKSKPGYQEFQEHLLEAVDGDLKNISSNIIDMKFFFEKVVSSEKSEIQEFFNIKKLTEKGAAQMRGNLGRTPRIFTQNFFVIRNKELQKEIALKKKDIENLKRVKARAEEIIREVDKITKEDNKSIKLWFREIREVRPYHTFTD